jgi:hypothetical protein
MSGLFGQTRFRGGAAPYHCREGAGVETAGGFRPRFPGAASFRLISRRIRDAFAAEAAEDPSGDWPPASDCWPMEVVTGAAARGEKLFHSRKNNQ